MNGPEPVLEIDRLSVAYGGPDARLAVDDVSLTVAPGELVALVGESGSGKSTIADATLGLLPPSAAVGGRVLVGGTDLVEADEHTREHTRGRVVTLVPQDTGTALNPVVAVVDQLAEVFQVHQHLRRGDARAEAARRLAAVGVDERVASQRLLPDELSGGMRQRALIAMAIALHPALVVADEPTTALDAQTTLGVLDALQRLRDDTGAAVLLITHDLGVAHAIATKVVVLYSGRVVEVGTADVVLRHPHHPYTRGLHRAMPSLARARPPEPIPGSAPSTVPPDACAFAPRCMHAVATCHAVRPQIVAVGTDHWSACPVLEPDHG